MSVRAETPPVAPLDANLGAPLDADDPLAEAVAKDDSSWPGRKRVCMLELTRSMARPRRRATDSVPALHSRAAVIDLAAAMARASDPSRPPADPRPAAADDPPVPSIEPLGFCAFDIQLPAHISRDVSGWIPDDLGGRPLFVAARRHAYVQHMPWLLGPRRDVPLLIWLTHRKLRVLYHCSPSEAWPLGKRLTHLTRDVLGCEVIEECAPAALASLLGRWVDADPNVSVLPWPAGGADPRPDTSQWSVPWTVPPMDRALTIPEEYQRESRYSPTRYLTYRDDPIVLLPVRVIIENPRLLPTEVCARVKDDPKLGPLMTLGPHRVTPMYAHYRALAVLLAVSGQPWRRRLTMFRNRVGAVLGCQTAISPVSQVEAAAMCRQMEDVAPRLSGAQEIYDPPYPGARTSPLDSAAATRLRRLLLRAVGMPVDEQDLPRMEIGALFN